jgi:hypothetical protein
MNTEKELEQAVRELTRGTFISRPDEKIED